MDIEHSLSTKHIGMLYESLLMCRQWRNIYHKWFLLWVGHTGVPRSWPLIVHVLDCFSFAVPWTLFKRCNHCRERMVFISRYNGWGVHKCPNCYLVRRGKFDVSL